MPTRRPIKGKKSQYSIADIRPVILQITGKYGATNVRIFGSFARGEQNNKSDIDLLVNLPKGTTLFDLSGLKIDLEEHLHRKVDVVSDDSIKPALRKRILSEARPLSQESRGRITAVAKPPSL